MKFQQFEMTNSCTNCSAATERYALRSAECRTQAARLSVEHKAQSTKHKAHCGPVHVSVQSEPAPSRSTLSTLRGPPSTYPKILRAASTTREGL
nr:MAG TPA: hypothetical protein [Caudoviricetes sp.]